MADIYNGPYIVQVSATILSDLTASGFDATATTKLKAAMSALKTLVCTQPAGQAMYPPDFAKIPAATAAKIAAEIDAISAAITSH